MIAFRCLMAAVFVVILGYTGIVMARDGANLLPIFFGNIAAMDWQGQFNVDFSSFLILSALWTAWRHEFSTRGLLLGVMAFFLGGLFLSAYLFIVTGQANGDVREVLLGRTRARG